jgi:hypothetical protein
LAKLRARGRTEIFRVSKAGDTSAETRAKFPDLVWRKHTVALMSDGTMLEKTDARWAARPGITTASQSSPGTWKVRGKIKAGLSVEGALEIYAKKGYEVESATGVSGFDRSYYAALAAASRGERLAPAIKPASLAGGPGRVIRTEKQAVRQKKAKEKRRESRKREDAEKHGAGFYVRNATTSMMGKLAAEQGPYDTLEEAIEKAWEKLRYFKGLHFEYLLPVEVVHAKSRRAAEWREEDHVYWVNGKSRGPKVSEAQLGLKL